MPTQRVDFKSYLQPKLRLGARLACLRHAASVHPEPGSNSQQLKSENLADNSASPLNQTIYLAKDEILPAPMNIGEPGSNSQQLKDSNVRVNLIQMVLQLFKMQLAIFNCQRSFSQFFQKHQFQPNKNSNTFTNVTVSVWSFA